jgi:hypothetical protein
MVSHEVVNFHDHTPNKMRSVMTDHAFQPTNLYRSMERAAESGASQLSPVQQSWIGKYFIPMGYEPANPQKNNYVYEKEIAYNVKPWIFRVLYIGQPNALKFMSQSTGIDTVSKPNADYHPGRLNIFVDVNDVIQKIEFL